jgi:hypothetical protein
VRFSDPLSLVSDFNSRLAYFFAQAALCVRGKSQQLLARSRTIAADVNCRCTALAAWVHAIHQNHDRKLPKFTVFSISQPC